MRTGLLAACLAGLVGGCSSGGVDPSATVRPFQGVKILVAAVGDQAFLQTVAVQRGEWQETQGAEAAIRQGTIDPKDVRAGEVDVVLFSADRLGDLVDAAALAVLPESLARPKRNLDAEPAPDGSTPEPPPDPLAFSDVLLPFRDHVAKYGSDLMALPCGGSALVLVYRRDAMERAENRSAASEAGLKLEPPRTWEELDALARFFRGRDWDGDGQIDAGIALALGADKEGLGEDTYLARAASLGQHPHQYSFFFDADSMEPRITTPPFVEAMAGLVAMKLCGPKAVETFDAEAARAAFRSGQAALLIDRAEEASRWSDPSHPIKVGVAALPGSERVYDPERKLWETATPLNRPSYLPRGGGWLAAVSASSAGRQREAALDFLKYLASPDTTNRLRADRTLPMLPIRRAQLGQGLPDPSAAPGIDLRQWTRAVTQTLTMPRVVPRLRIPHADDYLADLGKARAAALRGEPPEQALQAAAKAWSERTKQLGLKRQLWHYRRTLNTLATTPEPPAH